MTGSRQSSCQFTRQQRYVYRARNLALQTTVHTAALRGVILLRTFCKAADTYRSSLSCKAYCTEMQAPPFHGRCISYCTLENCSSVHTAAKFDAILLHTLCEAADLWVFLLYCLVWLHLCTFAKGADSGSDTVRTPFV